MYIVLIVVVLIYIWRIFKGSGNGLIDEVGALADIVIISFAVVSGIIVIESVVDKNLIGFLVSGIILLIILIAKKIIKTMFSVLKLVAELPVINGLNKFLGMIAGILEATALVWVGFACISCLRIPINGKILSDLITTNAFLNFLYQHNLLYNTIQKIIGIFLVS